MDDCEITEELIAVWKSMADHFLDTETRHDIPHTALLCLRAGLSVEEAHAVWLREVSPVVGANLLSVAGEWAAWDEEWLVGEVRTRALRRRSRPRGRPLAKLLARLRPDLNSSVWRSVERCMRELAEAPPERRDTLAEDLCLLARHYFDIGRWSEPALADSRRERLTTLSPTLFGILEPVTLGDERAAARERVERVLSERPGGA